MEENDELLRKELNSIYTPLSVAKEEIWKRLVPTPKKRIESSLQ
ncbi:MAG: hypothetical protein Q7S18_00110 [bacterium]|nr:hypothetical protein [bacterium]